MGVVIISHPQSSILSREQYVLKDTSPRKQLSVCVKYITRFLGCQLKKSSLNNAARDPCPALQIRASFNELAAVLVFSAFPFVAVKAIANSSLGETLQANLEKRKEEAKAKSERAIAAESEAKKFSPWYGENRPKWLGPLPFTYPSHLKGDYAGDYGFDVLSLGKQKDDFDKYFNFEILHGRWAMLSAMGAIVPELLVRYGGVQFAEPTWWKVGYAKLQGDTLDYLGVPGLHIAGGQGVLIIAISQIFLMAGPEIARGTGIEALEPLGIYLPGDINYPGGFLFDPLGIAKNPVAFQELKIKEIKNARLAMVAWVGFAAQAIATNKGPLENYLDFIRDPWNENIFAYLSSR